MQSFIVKYIYSGCKTHRIVAGEWKCGLIVIDLMIENTGITFPSRSLNGEYRVLNSEIEDIADVRYKEANVIKKKISHGDDTGWHIYNVYNVESCGNIEVTIWLKDNSISGS